MLFLPRPPGKPLIEDAHIRADRGEPGLTYAGRVELRDPAHQVSPRAQVLWTLNALGTIVVIAAVATVATWRGWLDIPALGWAGYAVLAAIYLWAMPTLRFRTHRWETTERAVYTQTGWLGRERRIAPMSRVQTVDFEQGALARALGLASVTVTTASAAGPLQIAGLDKATAERVVGELTQRANSETGDGT